MTQREWASPARPQSLPLTSVVLLVLVAVAAAMSPAHKLRLREEARAGFRHGWENYWQTAFPEDEVKPRSCTAHFRDRSDPRDIGRNDPLGDFSLTAIDSLSTLAIMAASDETEAERFWEAVDELGRIYWYNAPKHCTSSLPSSLAASCSNETSAWGRFQGRNLGARGFDIDAKVQVFETTIRGVGGLLSAHLFATGVLPSLPQSGRKRYDNELLLLAEDLATRLLPALTDSPTGIPYPRINLRHGLPHAIPNPRYYNRPLVSKLRWRPSKHPEHESECDWQPQRRVKREKPDQEVVETCTAGAGSLVLEFSTLSRLTGNPVFESAAKRAFNAIWSRRSAINLVGTGINAETGRWEGANSGIGAGVDSFFEYAFKAYVLLSGTEGEGHYLDVWEKARKALERHHLQREPVNWWNNVHLSSGAGMQGGAWIDSLSAFFAGVLSGSGSMDSGSDALELAIRTHLVYTALWARYGALPERYNTKLADVEGGLSWYPGRPEFVESTYMLYQATKDQYWLHVGEMAMRDLQKRCWAECGWAGLQDVRTGEQQDRMESFWLSETWKYLFLLFDEDNVLHSLDAPWVFTTEGHPLILPRPTDMTAHTPAYTSPPPPPRTCARPSQPTSFFSPMVQRADLFHSPAFVNFTRPDVSVYPPIRLPIPPTQTSAPLPYRDTLTLLFPSSLPSSAPSLTRIKSGIRINSLASLTLTLADSLIDPKEQEITKILEVAVGRGEKIVISKRLLEPLGKDPNFLMVDDENGYVDFVEVNEEEEEQKSWSARIGELLGIEEVLVNEEEVLRARGRSRVYGLKEGEADIGGCETGAEEGVRICEGRVWVWGNEVDMEREERERMRLWTKCRVTRKKRIKVGGRKVRGLEVV